MFFNWEMYKHNVINPYSGMLSNHKGEQAPDTATWMTSAVLCHVEEGIHKAKRGVMRVFSISIVAIVTLKYNDDNIQRTAHWKEWMIPQ